MVLSPVEVFAWQLNFYHRAVNPFSILLSKLISGQLSGLIFHFTLGTTRNWNQYVGAAGKNLLTLGGCSGEKSRSL
jgi:hypothetical protein